MKKVLSYLAIAISITAFGTDTIRVNSLPESATLYFSGTQVIRTGEKQIASGTHVIEFSELDLYFVEQSLRASVSSNCKVTDVHVVVKTEFDEGPIQVLRDTMQTINRDIETLKDRYANFNTEINILLGKAPQDGLPLEKGSGYMLDMANMYRIRLNEIYDARRAVQYEMELLKKRLNDLQTRVSILTRKQQKKFKTVYLTVENPTSQRLNFELRYFTPKASWSPEYSLRVPASDEEPQLEYIAKVVQSTGEDWTLVNITLSTEQPAWYLDMPQIQPFYLGQATRNHVSQPMESRGTGIYGTVTEFSSGQEVPHANIILKKESSVVSGTTSDLYGRFSLTDISPGYYSLEGSFIGFGTTVIRDFYYDGRKLNLNLTLKESSEVLNEVEVVEYDAPYIDADKSGSSAQRGRYGSQSNTPSEQSRLMEFDTEAQAEVFSFVLNKPHSLPSADRAYRLTYAMRPLKAKLQYFTAPGLEERIYRNVRIGEWENLDLNPGKISIYYGNTFSGVTDLNLNRALDTLLIPTGIASDVIVQREKMMDFTKKRFLQNKIATTTGYRIRISNTSKVEKTIEVADQIPVARRSEDSVELLESSDATYDEQSGILRWRIRLQPGETQEIIFRYSVEISR